jgi:hypothetical protein
MKIKGKIKKALKWAGIAYASAFLAINAHIIYDYNVNGPKKPELTLQVHNYDVEVQGKHKRLTLVGEIHTHNLEDKKKAEELISSNHFFANECNANTFYEMNVPEKVYLKTLSELGALPSFYYHLGSGREYSNMLRTAYQNKKEVFALETGRSSLEDLSTFQRLATIAMSAVKLPLAPLQYYNGKSEPKLTEEYAREKKILFKEENGTKRSIKMAREIDLLMRHPQIDSLLATTGVYHTYEIIQCLKSNPNLKLEEIK